jgi:putative nucleotide binding protein
MANEDQRFRASERFKDRAKGGSHQGEKKIKKTEHEPAGIIIEIYEDFLPMGVKSSDSFKKRYQVITVVGIEKFSILRCYLKNQLNTIAIGVTINLEELKHNFQLVKKLKPTEWSSILKSDIEEFIQIIVKKDEIKYVDFFNSAHLITTKLHQLKLLPGIGEKRLVQILKIRDQQPFISFEDIELRLNINPVELITKRIIEELETEQKYILFTKKYDEREK